MKGKPSPIYIIASARRGRFPLEGECFPLKGIVSP